MFAWRSKWGVKPALLLALVSVLLVAVPVSADRPIVITNEHDDDYKMGPQPCPGIEVWDHEVWTERITLYYDSKDNLVRVIVHAEGTDNFYDPKNPDAVLSGHFVVNVHFDAPTWEGYMTGVPWHITVPGYGTVVVRAGRWLEKEYPYGHIAGKDSFDSPQDMEQFCSLLAGD